MENNPIKLQDNFNLYSGDIITINSSNPLLIEVIDNQKVKLRNIEDNNNYLSKSKIPFSKSLDFSTNFEKALTFNVEQDSNGQISLQTGDNNKYYLKFNGKDFGLSPNKRLLTIDKKQNIEDIANYKEILISGPHKGEEIIKNEELLVIACKSYDNKTNNPLEHTFEFTEESQEEHNFTWSTDLTWGISAGLKLDCSAIAGIEISGNLEERSGTSKSITKTKKKSFTESFKVECAPWKKTRVKLLAKKVERITPYTARVKRVIDGRNYEYQIDGEHSYNSYSECNYSHKAITTRNILIVGWTGSGKSTLANVLSNSKDFVESNKSTSETKWGKASEEFEWKENYYCVIDNIGFGDTEDKVVTKDELIRIGKAINEAYQGLSHVLFVYKKRFSDKEKEAFGKLNALKITNSLITIVRTNFDNFEIEEDRENDKEVLKKESSEIKRVIDSCRGFLHVSNEDDGYSRGVSRKIVLDHLNDNCEKNPFKPKAWDDIGSLIDEYFAEKEKLEKEKNQAGDIQKGEIDQKINILKTDTAYQVKEKIKEEEIGEVFQLAQVIQEAK